MNIALILAGGTGTRLGAQLPKQYIEVGGKPIIAYCLKTLTAHPDIDGLQIVAEERWQDVILASFPAGGKGKFKGFSAPGATRQLSIWNGLQDILQYASEADVVLIHDAARPLVSERILTDCLKACVAYDGAIATIPVKDTCYIGRDGRIAQLIDRSSLMAGQAPEAFLLGKYVQANERLFPDEILQINGSTEPAVLAGMDIACVDGEERNFKITTPEDLERFTQIMKCEKSTSE